MIGAIIGTIAGITDVTLAGAMAGTILGMMVGAIIGMLFVMVQAWMKPAKK